MQLLIESVVTSGAGYDNRTRFVQGREKELGWVGRKMVREYGITEEDVKNSRYGLRAHLARMKAMDTLKIYHNSPGGIRRTRQRLSLGNQIARYENERTRAIVECGMRRIVEFMCIGRILANLDASYKS